MPTSSAAAVLSPRLAHKPRSSEGQTLKLSNSGVGGISKDVVPKKCDHCYRRAPCQQHPPSDQKEPHSPKDKLAPIQKNKQHRPRREAKLKRRASSSKPENVAMEPPVLSFYGTEPVPLPMRFAHIKKKLVEGHEAQLEASWSRLLDALRGEVDHIQSLGPNLTPSISFADIDDPSKTAPFARDLKRYGVGVVRGVVPKADADTSIAETVKYLENKHDFKPPPAQDPTCFDFFWSPAQLRTRAHPNVLQTQKFAMEIWDSKDDDRMATRFPISYADRIRIHGATLGGVGGGAKSTVGDGDGATNGTDGSATSATAAASAAAAAAAQSAIDLLGDFSSSTVIAQVDNGSLERWEPDGYGRGGTYDAVFRGDWESYDPWDPTGRVSTTQDLYNGYGACSIFRMYQGMIALSPIEPGLIRLLPSPRLATAYFLLRPFFSPKIRAPSDGRRDGPEWDAYLDAANWSLDRDQSTIIHGAVPGHAQRLTELWHPHLHLRRALITIPPLQTGDYIIWHPDLAYHITSNGSIAASRAATPPPDAAPQVSVLVYVPAAPLTQTSALYLARQRKTFQRGHPGPDFDATGSGLGSEASHTGRPTEADIEAVGGTAGLSAMGLAPFDVGGPGGGGGSGHTRSAVSSSSSSSASSTSSAAAVPAKRAAEDDEDVDMTDATAAGDKIGASESAKGGAAAAAAAEVEVARLANIILYPDRYDFYMARRNGNSTPRVKAEKSQG